MKVMIVDDFELARQLIRHAFGDNSSGRDEFLQAASGTEALSLIESTYQEGREIDILFLDLWLPGLNGLEVLKRIKAHPEWKKMKVILISAEAEKKNVEEALRLGAEQYIPKPISKDQIQKVIQDLRNSLTT